MVRFKSIIFITVLWLAVLLSGCIGDKNITETAKTTQTITATVTATPLMTPIAKVTSSPAIQTPAPSMTSRELPSNALYVTARMMKLSNWSTGNELKYRLDSLKVNVMNQINIPLTIKAQILSGDHILEEKTFTLEKQDSTAEFSNEKNHFINDTNVNLRLLIQGYPPIEYKFIEVDQLN